MFKCGEGVKNAKVTFLEYIHESHKIVLKVLEFDGKPIDPNKSKIIVRPGNAIFDFFIEPSHRHDNYNVKIDKQKYMRYPTILNISA